MQPETTNLNPGVTEQVTPPPQAVPPIQPPPAQPPVDSGAVYGGGMGSKKKIIGIIAGIIGVLLLTIILFFAFFRKSGEGSAEITYWGIWENEAVFQEIIQDFEKEYPNIKVKYENRADIKDVPGGYIAFLKTRINEGTGPDIFRFHNSWTSLLSSHLAPLPSSIQKEVDIEKNYYPVINSDMEVNGAYYGVPIGYDSLVMYVNDDILSAGGYSVPHDWLSFMDVARALTVIDEQTGEIKTSGASLGTYDNVDHAADILSLLSVQSSIDMTSLAGVNASTDEQAEQKTTLAKNKMVGVLDFYTCFAVESDICTPIWNNSMPNSKLAFVQGKVAFYFGYSWDILEINHANPNFKFSVHPVPQYDSSAQGKATLAGYWAEGVSIKSKAQAQSFQFLEFLSRKENMEKLFKAQSAQRPIAVAYPRKDMGDLLKNNPYLAAVVNQAPTAKSSLFYSDTYGGGEIARMDVYLGNAVRAVQAGESSSKTAVDKLAEGLYSIFVPTPDESK